MTSPGTSAQPRSDGPARRPALHRELRFFETTSVSVGVMAPTLAMSVTGVAAAVVSKKRSSRCSPGCRGGSPERGWVLVPEVAMEGSVREGHPASQPPSAARTEPVM